MTSKLSLISWFHTEEVKSNACDTSRKHAFVYQEIIKGYTMREKTATVLCNIFIRAYSSHSFKTTVFHSSKWQLTNSFRGQSSILGFSRCLGSRSGSVDKDSPKKTDHFPFPEKSVVVYTCEKLYNEWKKSKKYFRIPDSGVFAKVNYIDTLENATVDGKRPRTVLCIHGIPGNYAVFSHLIKALSKEGVRVIVPTFPGTLYLPGVHKDELFRHSVEEKTQLFKDFLKCLDVSEVDCIIAHSSAIYPALQLVLDPELNVKGQVLLNTGGHKKTITMRPYWIVWTCSQLYLTSLGRIFVRKTGRFIMKHILRTPIKDDNIDGIMLLAVTMMFSQYWKTEDLFTEISRKELPTLFCFSEDDKVVEKKLSYEVVSLLGASKDNVYYFDEEAKLKVKGNDLSWLKLMSFKKGSHYVFRKHPEICNQQVIELLNKLDK